jgi:hypothetical protein
MEVSGKSSQMLGADRLKPSSRAESGLGASREQPGTQGQGGVMPRSSCSDKEADHRKGLAQG